MLEHHERRILPYTAEELFDLVIDIKHYPEFIPWVRGMRVREKTDKMITADLAVGYKMYAERFTSKVTFTRPHKIHVDYIKGPLKQLSNDWSFMDLPDGKCEVDFYVQFSFKSKIMQSLANQFFDVALSRMINAFEKEAKKRYGDRS